VEKVRELSIAMMSAAAETLQNPSPMLAPLLPAVASRIGVAPVEEEAEELRLQMVQLLGGPLLARYVCPAAMQKLRIVTVGFRVGDRSRGRFAPPVDLPRHDCSSRRGLHARRECLGFVPHSRSIFCRPVRYDSQLLHRCMRCDPW
jgi:hypothetical protein